MNSDNVENTAYVVTKTLMNFIIKEYMDENQLHQLLQRLGINKPGEDIFFLTQLSIALRKYPNSVFTSDEVRINFLEVIQNALDAKILDENQ